MKKPTWISHRGLWQGVDENSRVSFNRALDAGFTFLETDLRPTKDDVLVLAHDLTFERVAGDTRKVHEITIEELKEMRMLEGEEILSLKTFLNEYSHVRHVYDIKPETAVRVIELIDQYEVDFEKSIFLFWEKAHEDLFLQKYPNAICFARLEECKRAGFASLLGVPFLGGIQKDRIYSIPPVFMGISFFKERVIREYHKRGAKVLAFLPELESEVETAQRLGFDYVLSNHARGLVKSSSGQ